MKHARLDDWPRHRLNANLTFCHFVGRNVCPLIAQLSYYCWEQKPTHHSLIGQEHRNLWVVGASGCFGPVFSGRRREGEKQSASASGPIVWLGHTLSSHSSDATPEGWRQRALGLTTDNLKILLLWNTFKCKEQALFCCCCLLLLVSQSYD